jgi:hypothetical protein
MSTDPGRHKSKKLPSDTSVTVIKKCTGSRWRFAKEVADRAQIAEGDIAREQISLWITS